MSLLMDRQFIVEHLRLAMVSMQDAASEGVVVLNMNAPEYYYQESASAASLALADARARELSAKSPFGTRRSTQADVLAPAAAAAETMVKMARTRRHLRWSGAGGAAGDDDLDGYATDEHSHVADGSEPFDVVHALTPPPAIRSVLLDQQYYQQHAVIQQQQPSHHDSATGLAAQRPPSLNQGLDHEQLHDRISALPGKGNAGLAAPPRLPGQRRTLSNPGLVEGVASSSGTAVASSSSATAVAPGTSSAATDAQGRAASKPGLPPPSIIIPPDRRSSLPPPADQPEPFGRARVPAVRTMVLGRPPKPSYEGRSAGSVPSLPSGAVTPASRVRSLQQLDTAHLGSSSGAGGRGTPPLPRAGSNKDVNSFRASRQDIARRHFMSPKSHVLSSSMEDALDAESQFGYESDGGDEGDEEEEEEADAGDDEGEANAENDREGNPDAAKRNESTRGNASEGGSDGPRKRWQRSSAGQSGEIGGGDGSGGEEKNSLGPQQTLDPASEENTDKGKQPELASSLHGGSGLLGLRTYSASTSQLFPEQTADLFTRRPLEELKNSVAKSPGSMLSAMLNTKFAPQNPFAAAYSRYSGKNSESAMDVAIHMSFANAKEGESIVFNVSVSRTATVEEVIGYALFEWVESGRSPVLRSAQLDVKHWAMRIVEDDGEIDEDFPALERVRPIHRFMFDAFALCETEPLPDLPSTPSSPNGYGGLSGAAGASQDTVASGSASGQVADGSTTFASTAGSLIRGQNAAATPQVKLFIKVHLYSTIEVRHTTTLNVAPTTTLRVILEAVCKKRCVNPRDYVLKLSDMQTSLLDLDKPFASVGDVSELFLMKKSIGTSAGDMFLRPPGEETQPLNSPAAFLNQSDLGGSSIYKKFTVVRKMNMFLGRQERVLALDGEYIHLMPPENKQFFDNVKTITYRITAVVVCKQNKKLQTNFRLEVLRSGAEAPVGTASIISVASTGTGGRETKTYDFEAQSIAEATEICTQINSRLQTAKRNANATAGTATHPALPAS